MQRSGPAKREEVMLSVRNLSWGQPLWGCVDSDEQEGKRRASGHRRRRTSAAGEVAAPIVKLILHDITLDLVGGEVSLLQLMSQNCGPVNASIISVVLKINCQRVQYHLERLSNAKYVRLYDSLEGWYELDHKGREYLVANRLDDSSHAFLLSTLTDGDPVRLP